MPLPAAASVSVARVLTGPIRAVTVTASLSDALYVSTLDPFTPAVCLAAADAVRVPCALVLGPGVLMPTASVGAPAWLGEGQLRLGRGGTSAAVTRWWRPARPRLEKPSSLDLHAVGRTTVDGSEGGLADILEPAAALGAALVNRSPAALAKPVRALLGRGPGLTPLGDDVLAGTLVTLHAAGHQSVRPLIATLASALAVRPANTTTPVSAALLAHAGRGECVPQLAAVLDAVSGPERTLADAVAELLRVGHSSGGGLLLGVRIGLESLLDPDRAADRTPPPRASLVRSAGRHGIGEGARCDRSRCDS